jgi:GNAT superfamily N-acetyltransferase
LLTFRPPQVGLSYERLPASDVYIASAPNLLRAGTAGSGVRVELVEKLDDVWVQAWAAILGAPPRTVAALRTSLALIQLPTAYCTLLVDGVPAAVGRASYHESWAGFFNFATAPSQRGRSFAGNIVHTLAEWCAANGVSGFYLQVDGDNSVAKRAYMKSGFRPFYRYHYLASPCRTSSERTPAARRRY